jgi:phosphoribosyl 1,2-cyclic phosphodiesterase
VAMRIRFWGVRGSIPVPGPDTVAVGGNTSCVEVRCGKTLVILDGGTGIRLLGQSLLGEMPLVAHVFFSHVHWDHIQGFPFFTPAFVRGNVFHLYGGNDVTRTLEETLAGQMDYPSFPVHLSEMGAKMTFHDLDEGQVVQVGEGEDVRVCNARGNHPNGVYAYRIDWGGKALAYCTDTEHYSVVDSKLRKLAAGADVLVYDAMYLPEEYAGTQSGMPRTGWGHSTFEHGVELARAAGVRRLVLFHHDPGQNDAAVADKERRARLAFPETVAAREGLVIEL